MFNIAGMSVGGRRRGKYWVASLGSSLMTEHTNQDSTETRLPRRHTMGGWVNRGGYQQHQTRAFVIGSPYYQVQH